MVKTKVMENHGGPVIFQKLPRYMPRYVVVHLCKVLNHCVSLEILEYCYIKSHRYKEARGSIRTVEKSRKELQPRVVSVHDQPTILLRLHLCKPGILCCKSGACIGLGEIENNIQETRYRSRGDGLYPWHCDCRGTRMAGKGQCGAGPDQTATAVNAVVDNTGRPSNTSE
jgi:hypothetical protein